MNGWRLWRRACGLLLLALPVEYAGLYLFAPDRLVELIVYGGCFLWRV